MNQITSPKLPDWTTRQIITGTLLVLLVALGFWFLYQVRLVVFTFFTAVIIGTAFRPAIDWLQRRGASRVVAAGLVGSSLFVLLGILALFLVPPLAEQISTIAANLPAYYQSLRNWLLNSPNLMLQQLAWQFPPTLLSETAPQTGEVTTTETMSQTLEYADWIFKGAFALVATLVLSFYWMLDGQRAIRTFLLLIPISQRKRGREIIETMEIKVGAYIRGQIILCLIIGGLSLVAYLIIGLPYPLVLALIAGIMEAVPVIGPALGAVPAILVAISSNPSMIIWVVVATLIIQFLENNFLVPKVMDKAVGINPLVTYLALIAFGSIFGVVGAILAIPLAVILQLLLDRFLLSSVTLDQQVMAGRGWQNVLRYHIQQLVQDVRQQTPPEESNLDEEAEEIKEEIEAIAADLDSILVQIHTSKEPA